MLSSTLRVQASLLVFVVVAIAATTTRVDAFQFAMQPNVKVCFAHESGADSTTVSMHYIVHASEGTGTMNAVILSPPKVVSMTEQLKLGGKEQTLNFNTAMAGRWDVCVTWMAEYTCRMEVDLEGTVDLNFRDPTVTPADYGVITDKLMPLFDKAETEMDYLSKRQQEFERTTKSTYFRVVVFTILEFLLVVGAVGWQIWSLRRFFKEKKVV